jgi:hypothetical protein
MLNLLRRASLVGLVAVVVISQSRIAQAQGGRRPLIRRYQGATAEPTISPYLRLIQPGSDPGLNYFNLVQPQLVQQQNFQQQSRQIRGLNTQLQQDERQGPFGSLTQIRPTGGRAASYQNYSHYYPSMGGGGGGGGASRNYKLPSSGGGMGMGMGMGGMGMGGGF